MIARIALAHLAFPQTPAAAVANARSAVVKAGALGAAVVCFPENYVPGYRGSGHHVEPPTETFLEAAWRTIADAAAEAHVGVVLGTERIVDGAHRASALVIGPDGEVLGVQDKVQVDPSEEGLYAPGDSRRLFRIGPLSFGVVICHEGWRYPETVRWAVRAGAQVVFHPHFHDAGDIDAFHPHAVRCRAAENTCYFASVNYASADAPTTSAVANPDGAIIAAQPQGREGLLIADLDLPRATGLLAQRFRPIPS